MPSSIVIVIFLVAGCLSVLIWTVGPWNIYSHRQIRRNLSQGMEDADAAVAANRRGTTEFGRRFAFRVNREKLERQLALAGRPGAWPLSRLLLAKPILAALAGAAGLLFLSAAPSNSPLAPVIVLVVIVVAYFLPDLLVHSRAMERQSTIGFELPDTLDQMLIAVEAGLGFEASMSRAGQNGKGPLAEELVRTLQDMRVGMSRREAYQSLADRTAVPDLRAFIRAVVQADVYGISISAVLRNQAKEMRTKRRQRAEEKAMQIPVKVLFPLMLFILPVLFITVLGPTVLSILPMLTGQP